MVSKTESLSESILLDQSRSTSNRPGMQRSVGFKGINVISSRSKAQSNHDFTAKSVFVPWSPWYKTWWMITVLAAFTTVLTETFQMAFPPAGLYPYNDTASIIEYSLVSIFFVDIFFNFNLAYDRDTNIIVDRKLIAIHYIKTMFWVDVVGVFPFYPIVLAATGQLGKDTQLSELLGLLRLLRLVRVHRGFTLFQRSQYSTKISLMWLTLIRNFTGAFLWTHFNACIIYFIAKLYSFDPETTWIGDSMAGLSMFERYITSLYLAVTTFATVGYGDFSPVNAAEQIWGIFFMLLNLTIGAWFIGSVTLLIVKGDERTGQYRQALTILQQYTTMHNFDKGFIKLLQTQLKLDFHNREIADEKVLSCFPQSLRRKVIRKLYLSSLIRSDLMKGIRQQFIDEFLSSCRVELFSPGEEILLRGGSSTDLYLLVEGSVRLFPLGNGKGEDDKPLRGKSDFGASSIPDSDATGFHRMAGAEDMVAGEFINDISFFTDSPESYTVRPIVVCKTLTISQAVFKVLAHDHPGSTGKILKNLLDKVARLAEDTEAPRSVVIPKNMTKHVAGSLYGDSSYHSGMDLDPSIHALDVQRSIIAAQHQSSFSKLQDLIKLHINKHKDVETTRFLFAASRSDTATISLMCDHGFDPDSADYDFRTALMVSAMKGHTETVRLLLEYGANPNLVDMHGSSALYEATKSGSEATMEELLKHRAGLCMEDNHAASLLCQAVFDGDVIKLRRLLRANIHVNASDYDKRAAVHIAGAEGNLAALKVLIEHGADLTMQDRWGNTAYSEAKNADAGQIINYLEQLET